MMHRLLIGLTCLAIAAGAVAAQPCPGDLSGDCEATIDEIIAGIGSALEGCPAPAPRFTDNHDGTIGDARTGLNWEKKVAGDRAENPADPHDVDTRYPWAGTCADAPFKLCQPTAAAAAACQAQAGPATPGCRECGDGDGACEPDFGTETAWSWLVALNQARFAGHDDWRLPTVEELQGILEFGAAVGPAVDPALHAPTCGADCVDLAAPACSCNPTAGGTWSVTLYAREPNKVWSVYTGSGHSVDEPSTAYETVRAVRGRS